MLLKQFKQHRFNQQCVGVFSIFFNPGAYSDFIVVGKTNQHVFAEFNTVLELNQRGLLLRQQTCCKFTFGRECLAVRQTQLARLTHKLACQVVPSLGRAAIEPEPRPNRRRLRTTPLACRLSSCKKRPTQKRSSTRSIDILEMDCV